METDYGSEQIITKHAAKMRAMRERLERACIEKKHNYTTVRGYPCDIAFLLQNDYVIAFEYYSPVIDERFHDQSDRFDYGEIMKLDGKPLPIDMVKNIGEMVAKEPDRHPKLYFYHYTIGQRKNKRHLNRVTWLGLQKFWKNHPGAEVYAITFGRLLHLKYILDTYLDPTT